MKLAPLPPVNSSQKISAGGFGTVFPDPEDGSRCIKVFNTPIEGRAAEVLIHLTSLRNWARPSDADHLNLHFAWPQEVFGEPDVIHGYSMPLAPPTCYFDLVVVRREIRQLLLLKFLFDGPYWESAAVRSSKPSVSFQDRVEIAINAMDSIRVLHRYGLSYGDVSGNNIAARLDIMPRAFFFDVDSISPVDLRAKEPLRSPGWETPQDFGPLEIDHSRLAILVARLLTEDLNATPDNLQELIVEDKNSGFLRQQIMECYSTGTEATFNILRRSLRRIREQDRTKRAVEFAQKSGYARRVLLELADVTSTQYRDLATRAHQQLERERAIEKSKGFERRRILRQRATDTGNMVLDVLPQGSQLEPIRTLDELKALIYDACFEEIAIIFNSNGLGNLEDSSWVLRALQRALLEIDYERLKVTTAPGQAVLTFDWPHSVVTNTALLTVEIGSDRQRFLISRPQQDASSKQHVRAPLGATGKASLRFCAQSPTGNRISSPLSTDISLQIPPRPAPQPQRGVRQGQAIQGQQSRATFAVIDPTEELRQRRLAEHRERQRRKQQRIRIGVTASTAIFFLTGSFFLGLLDPIIGRSDTKSVGSRTTGRPFVSLEDSTLTIDVVGFETAVDAARISTSNDGASYAFGKWILLSQDKNSIELTDIPATFYKIDLMDGSKFIVSNIAISEVYEGFASIPTIVVDEDSFQAQWIRATPSPGENIIYFEYQYLVEGQSPSREPIRQTYLERTPATNITALEDNLVIQIRAVYASGRQGRWVTATR